MQDTCESQGKRQSCEQILEKNYPVGQKGNSCFLTFSIRILVGMTVMFPLSVNTTDCSASVHDSPPFFSQVEM